MRNSIYLLKRRNIGINIEINCTYVNLGMLLLFLCNLGSIHGHFIRFWGSLFMRCCFLTWSEARQVTACSIDSQISPVPMNGAPIRHRGANSLRPNKSLISSLRHGYCDAFFWGNNFGKLSVLGNLACAQETRWRRVARWTRTFYIRSSNWIIPNTAHAQSVDCLRVGRSMSCHAILITRIPWVHVRE